VAALEHPMPEVRKRICWLIGENKIGSAIPYLVKVADHDSDLFVGRAARAALTVLLKGASGLTADCL
jgi:hypothetical protein